MLWVVLEQPNTEKCNHMKEAVMQRTLGGNLYLTNKVVNQVDDFKMFDDEMFLLGAHLWLVELPKALKHASYPTGLKFHS